MGNRFSNRARRRSVPPTQVTESEMFLVQYMISSLSESYFKKLEFSNPRIHDSLPKCKREINGSGTESH